MLQDPCQDCCWKLWQLVEVHVRHLQTHKEGQLGDLDSSFQPTATLVCCLTQDDEPRLIIQSILWNNVHTCGLSMMQHGSQLGFVVLWPDLEDR
jgi:hypothetical protein